jgi:hypothetical protein
MTNAEMDAIQVDNTPVLLQLALAPGFILLGERLVEAADGTVDFERLPLTFGPLPQRISCARASHEHLGESFRNVGFVHCLTKNLPWRFLNI